MATEQSENPLLSLSRDKQQTLVDLVEDGDIDQISEQTGLSRRQVLGIGGALLASAGVGGVTANEIVQAVEADASTTDSDGNVGLPGDRVDVYADGVDTTSLSTANVNTVRNAAEFSGAADGIQAAINDLPAEGGAVYVPGGEGSGPNGEYIYDPGSGGSIFVRDVVLFGDGTTEGGGEGTVIKVADTAASDYDAVFDVTVAGMVRDLAIDGNKANQTDGGDNLNQLGIDVGSDGRLVNVEIFRTQYAPVLTQGVAGARIVDLDAHDCGEGPHSRETSQGNGQNIRWVRPRVVNCGGASASLADGLILGDNMEDVVVRDAHVRPRSNTNTALLVEQSEKVRVEGGEYHGKVRYVSNNRCRFNATVDSGDFEATNGFYSVYSGEVHSPPNGVTISSTNWSCRVTTTISKAGDVPLTLKGIKRSLTVEANISRADAANPAIRLEDDGFGNACTDVGISGTVRGNGNITYAVQAADSNQTGLVDGLVASNMATGDVDNPGGLTVGDVL